MVFCAAAPVFAENVPYGSSESAARRLKVEKPEVLREFVLPFFLD